MMKRELRSVLNVGGTKRVKTAEVACEGEGVARAKAVWLVTSKGASGDARELKSVMARGYSSSNKGV